MRTTVTKTPQARQDLLELADYIARDSLNAAERFLDAAEAAFQLLASMPEMGTLSILFGTKSAAVSLGFHRS